MGGVYPTKKEATHGGGGGGGILWDYHNSSVEVGFLARRQILRSSKLLGYQSTLRGCEIKDKSKQRFKVFIIPKIGSRYSESGGVSG